MKGSHIKCIVFYLLTILTLLSCNQSVKKEGWTVSGTIEGYGNGIMVVKRSWRDTIPVECEIVNGAFTASGEAISEPLNFSFHIKEEPTMKFNFFVENGKANYTGKLIEQEIKYSDNSPVRILRTVEKVKLVGSIVNDHIVEFEKGKKKIIEEMPIPKDCSKDEKEKLQKERGDKLRSYTINFIKNHPDAYFASLLAINHSGGRGVEARKKMLALLDPNLDNSHVRAMKKEIAEAKEVKIADIINASNVSFKIDNSFKGAAYTNIIYLGRMSNDKVCALCKGGIVKIIDKAGKEQVRFETEMNGVERSLTVDSSDNIYVISSVKEIKEFKKRGKVFKVSQPVGVECAVFSKTGKHLRNIKLKDIYTGSGARIIDNKLVVSDCMDKKGGKVGIFNKETGEAIKYIKNLRPCCGIMDIGADSNNNILLANLGAFRVAKYNLKGEKLASFGKRGKKINDFHGCCNPVSVNALSNGAIVTVEKEPTRIKIYSKEGAKKIEGIKELVKGCTHIPLMVDSKDNLYLASPAQGLLKCVAM